MPITSVPGRGRPVLPAAQRGASCPVDHPCRGPLLLHAEPQSSIFLTPANSICSNHICSWHPGTLTVHPRDSLHPR
eukprot:1195879-Prorocentrum_minimum.AAC.3